MVSGKSEDPWGGVIERGSLGIDASDSEVRNCYFWYLCDLGGFSGRKGSKYRCKSNDPDEPTYFVLAERLFNTDFIPLVPNDDNRAVDGKALRSGFSHVGSAFKNYDAIDNGPCSVLEMLIALSERIDRDIMQGLDGKWRGNEWLWEILGNLGLDKFDDDHFDFCKIAQIIDQMVKRGYSKVGKGGMFPLKNPAKNQRNVEIWWQAQAYFQENH